LDLLPEEIGELDSLKELNLSFNNLKHLPASIGQLHQLEFLDVQYNYLEELPASIGDLHSLHFLIIGKNALPAIPIEIANLQSLLELDVAYSGAALRLPESLCNTRSLETMYADHSAIIPNCLLTKSSSRFRLIIR